MKKNRKSSLIPTVFTYTDPLATTVFLAGSFNDWNAGSHPLASADLGRWQIEMGLQRGRYEYLFVVDGKWTPDPAARESAPNPHGGTNSVVVI